MTPQKIMVRPDALTQPEYQRNPNPVRVKKIAQDFDPNAVGAITVARRDDGTLVIVDGGHRAAAALAAKYDGKLYALLHEGLTIQQEAGLFLELNDSRQLVPHDRFHASLLAEVPRSLAIQRILAAHGWAIAKGSRDGGITAVSRVEKIISRGGSREECEHHLDSVIGIITRAWKHSKDAATAEHLMGVSNVLIRYPDAKVDRIVKVLSTRDPRIVRTSGISKAAASNWSYPAGVAGYIVDLYNGRLQKGRLDPWVWKN